MIPQNRFPVETVSTPVEIPDLIGYFQKSRDFKATKTCKIAGFFWQGFWERAGGHLSMRSAARWLLWGVFRIYIGEFCHKDSLSAVTSHKKTLLGAKAPPRGRPPLSDSAVLPSLMHAPDAGNTECIACAPRPPRGTDGARGGLRVTVRSCPHPLQYFPTLC